MVNVIMTQAAASSYVLTTLKHIFQCGSLNDVSDYVATSAAKTKERTSTKAKEEGPGAREIPATLTSAQQKQQDHDEGIPGLEPSSSSASSIYAVPSREALEELVRDSKGTRRRGLFDMDRLFACGSMADHEDVLDEAEEVSVFSRSALRSKSKRKQLQYQDQMRMCCSGQNPMAQVDDAYHYMIHLSPPREHLKSSATSPGQDTIELRKTMSDSMSHLPEGRRSSSESVATTEEKEPVPASKATE